MTTTTTTTKKKEKKKRVSVESQSSGGTSSPDWSDVKIMNGKSLSVESKLKYNRRSFVPSSQEDLASVHGPSSSKQRANNNNRHSFVPPSQEDFTAVPGPSSDKNSFISLLQDFDDHVMNYNSPFTSSLKQYQPNKESILSLDDDDDMDFQPAKRFNMVLYRLESSDDESDVDEKSKNFNILETHIFDHKPDLIAITETFLKPSVNGNIFSIPGYSFHHHDRIGKKGGGVPLYARNGLVIKALEASNPRFSNKPEFVFYSVTTTHAKLLLAIVYRRPKAAYPKALFDLLPMFFASFDNIIITGDFNINMATTNPHSTSFRNLISTLQLSIVNTQYRTYAPCNLA
ncbi:hypothetical protein TKK_0016818 [Trichogramma kaykai]